MAFTYRNVKGSELTYVELDENFQTMQTLHDDTLIAKLAAESAAAMYPDMQIAMMAMATNLINTQTIVVTNHAFV